MTLKYILFVPLFIVNSVYALNDGLVQTPPMGWLSWERSFSEIDCDKYLHSCINEQLYKYMAERLAADVFALK
jgi:hypothetical protein